ncbi:PHP domain-containing protein [Congregibacter variabilis]|uniref:PHP domain-containing protein n=1 Tax=Congregibacter variabilis TaxID=3081200 RepID=A0ABZ0IAG6_9GAMM|nr:PHP domain-containing protein [Congregibacter sp. IMCC43200]
MIDWLGEANSLQVDMHTHTRFSDGRWELSKLADSALLNGCHAIAITDHAEKGSDAATPTYLHAITEQRQRSRYPLIIAGLEWNIPPYRGREHVNILVHPSLEPQLIAFSQHFRKTNDPGPALQWLSERNNESTILAFYNHPARRDERLEENEEDFLSWTPKGSVIVGFEGGPGHQKKASPGDYKNVLATVDGWDPVVADVGGVWDSLLDAGRDPWGALANSDFHNDRGDYLPCEFSRTHVDTPEMSASGVLRGLKAGAFWGETGAFLQELRLRVGSPDLIFDASPGESFALGDQRVITVEVMLKPELKAKDQTLTIELIGNLASGEPEVIETRAINSNVTTVTTSITNPIVGGDGESGYLRIRVSSEGADGRRFIAYTNHVRVLL